MRRLLTSAAVAAALADFAAEHPNIRVDHVNVPFAWLGCLAPFDGTYNGRSYGVPQVTDAFGLLYNKELLKKAGYAEPPATMADLKKAALDVRSKTGAGGLALNVDAYFLLPFICGEGGDFVDVRNKKITISSPRTVAGVKIVEDLITSGAAVKPAPRDSYTNAETAWAEVAYATAFMTGDDTYTLAVGLSRFVGRHRAEWGLLTASSVLIAIPAAAVFLLVQRHLVTGLTAGATKA
ncbi:extracellular solute-binding protein [Microbispora bryophytorum]|uniref:Extracellular solute-binding protein n=1 Tax=Microbispora bryophytorum subsp. camponoti TaxID=1677852 RepID=A0ABR8L732_9ACTN|nr:extracellular solute-binding protein [Microbispora camponoti]MBD3146718.1 extracellular solute-binding protein [Microbispora camponoti]